MAIKKLLGAAAFSVALVGGGVTGALVGSPVTSAAQTETTTAPSTTTPSTAAPSIDGTTDDTPAPGTGSNAADARGDCAGGGRGGGPDLDTAATALGVTEAELRDALDDGTSIADVAEQRGVDVQEVIDALVAEASTRIDEKVAEGDLDAAEAAERKQELTERITDRVNGEAPEPGAGGPRGPRASSGGAEQEDSGS